MSYRFMRVIVFFDLPTETNDEKREYRAFRSFLIKNGFVMMQESVYSKIVLNNTVLDTVCRNIRRNKAKKGLIQVLTVTERQFEKMEFIAGTSQSSVIDSDEKLVVI